MPKKKSARKTTWTVDGELLVRHEFGEIATAFGNESPLAGVRVRLAARERLAGVWGPWRKWGETTTNSSGLFRFTKEKDKSQRQFKIDVMFKDDELKIYPENNGLIKQAIEGVTGIVPGSDELEDALQQALEQLTRVAFRVEWITVRKETKRESPHPAGTVNFGPLLFRRGNRDELGSNVAGRHAQIWFLYKQVFALFDSFGADLSFRRRRRPVAIKYPHDNPLVPDRIEAPYSNPVNDTIYIVRNRESDFFRLDTLLHELMHVWAYLHCRGENRMATYLLKHGTTHGSRREGSLTVHPFAAFHEGFAEWAAHQVHRALFSSDPDLFSPVGVIQMEQLPFSRPALGDLFGINNLDAAQRHELGWLSLFNLLVTPQVHELNFDPGPASVGNPFAARQPGPFDGCNSPQISFQDVLRAFTPNAAAGLAKELTNDEMRHAPFLDRLAARRPDFGPAERDLYIQLLNPASAVQPQAALCGT